MKRIAALRISPLQEQAEGSHCNRGYLSILALASYALLWRSETIRNLTMYGAGGVSVCIRYSWSRAYISQRKNSMKRHWVTRSARHQNFGR